MCQVSFLYRGYRGFCYYTGKGLLRRGLQRL